MPEVTESRDAKKMSRDPGEGGLFGSSLLCGARRTPTSAFTNGNGEFGYVGLDCIGSEKEKTFKEGGTKFEFHLESNND